MSGPVAADDERITYISLEEAAHPAAGRFDHRTDRWWVVHPEKGLVIWKGYSAQCNNHKQITEQLRDRLYPWAEVRFFESVFTPAIRD